MKKKKKIKASPFEGATTHILGAITHIWGAKMHILHVKKQILPQKMHNSHDTIEIVYAKL